MYTSRLYIGPESQIPTLPLKKAFPTVPSKEIPVADVLLPLWVRKICAMYMIALVAFGVISNALAMKSMQDIQRKKSVAHLMKPMPPFFCCNFLLVKVIVII